MKVSATYAELLARSWLGLGLLGWFFLSSCLKPFGSQAAPVGVTKVSVRTAVALRVVQLKRKLQLKEMPPSRIYKFIKLDKSVTHRLPPVAPQATPEQGKTGQRLPIGIVRSLPLDPLAHGKWFDLEPHGQAGILAIISEGAAQVRVHFLAVALPPGAKLFVYSMEDADEIYGPYEGRGPAEEGAFWTPPVKGEGVVIECFSPVALPRAESASRPFRISEISHVFRR